MSNTTKYVAIQGAPGAGKSTLQKMLHSRYRFHSIDDGRVLRDIAIRAFGLTEWHVSTQEGKASFIPVGDEQFQVRKILGDLGKWFEGYFGPNVLAVLALKDADRSEVESLAERFTFGSVRKTQGAEYKARGGIVVEVQRDGCEAINDFDKYAGSLSDYVIANNGTETDLWKSMVAIFDPLFHAEAEAKLKAVISRNELLDIPYHPDAIGKGHTYARSEGFDVVG